MRKKRDTRTYVLKKGRETVYIGETKDIKRTEERHKSGGKKFDKIHPTSYGMTKEGAKKREAEKLETYRKNHGGKNPKYNKDSDG